MCKSQRIAYQCQTCIRWYSTLGYSTIADPNHNPRCAEPVQSEEYYVISTGTCEVCVHSWKEAKEKLDTIKKERDADEAYKKKWTAFSPASSHK